MTIRELFCHNLKRLMKENDFTTEGFAEHYGKSLKYIQKLMYGGQWPSDKTIEALAKSLGVKSFEFFAPPPKRLKKTSHR